MYTGLVWSSDHLAHALPCWADHHGRGSTTQTPPGGVVRPSSLPAVIGCPHCAIARTGQAQPIPRYLPHHRLVCARHHTWALGPHTLHGIPVPRTHTLLHQTPEIVRAHHAHLRLTRRWGPDADEAITQAAGLTEHWRRHAPKTERVWRARARLIGNGQDASMWEVLAREAITYPETITLAGLLTRRPSTRYHRPRPGQPHPLHTTIARLLNRRWLQNPAHYPQDLSHYIRHTPRHPTDQTAYRHHTKPTGHKADTIELTPLGHQPPHPHAATGQKTPATYQRPVKLRSTQSTCTTRPRAQNSAGQTTDAPGLCADPVSQHSSQPTQPTCTTPGHKHPHCADSTTNDKYERHSTVSDNRRLRQ